MQTFVYGFDEGHSHEIHKQKQETELGVSLVE